MYSKYLNNKNILVTGSTGTFGSEFIKTVISKYNPNKVIVFSRDEMKQYKIQVIGIRPNEKLHEEIVTVSYSLHTTDCGTYYIILPSNYFLLKSIYDKKNKIKSKSCECGFTYNSHDNSDWLTVDNLKILVEEFLEN